MNPAIALALILDLYTQLQATNEENARLRQQLDAALSSETVPVPEPPPAGGLQ